MMMDNLYQAIDDLSGADFEVLSEYIEQQRERRRLAQFTPQERLQQIEIALVELHAGLTPIQINELTEAMNGELVEHRDDLEFDD